MGLKSLKSLKSLKKHSYFAMDISDGLKSQKKHRFLHIPPCEFSLQPEALLQSCENKTQSFSVCFETSTVPIQENMYFSGVLRDNGPKEYHCHALRTTIRSVRIFFWIAIDISDTSQDQNTDCMFRGPYGSA